MRAITEHYALCTWTVGAAESAPGTDKGTQYTVVSWRGGWRGPHGSWGHGATTDEDCQATLAALEAGEIEMSHRRSIHLDISAVLRDGKVVFSDAAEEAAEE